MLSAETLESYRRMTPGQRLRLTLDLTLEAEKALFQGTPQQVARRFELLEKQNDERTAAICEGLAKTKNDLNASP